MNRKQLIYLVVLGVVIGGLAIYTARRGAASYQTSGQSLGQKVLPGFPMNDVGHILIEDGTNDLNVVKVDGRWQVRERHGYPADFSVVGELLRKFWDMKVVQSEEVGPSQWGRLELVEPGEGAKSGTKLTFSDGAGERIATVVLGRKHVRQGGDPTGMGGGGWPDGRYLRVLNGSQQVALVSDALTEVEAKADRFLDKEFVRVEKLKSIAVRHPGGEGSWGLSREAEGGAWKLEDAGELEKVDSSKVSFANSVLAYASFVDVASSDASAEETGMDDPVVAELETFEGFRYVVKVGKQATDDNRYFAVAVEASYPKQRVAGEEETEEEKARLDKEFQEKLTRLDEKLAKEKRFGGWTYVVSKWTVDSLLKKREELISVPAEGDTPEVKEEEGEDEDVSGIPGLDLENLGVFPDR
jgi:hypothetical protein